MYRDDETIVAACPFCYESHAHPETSLDSSGNVYTAPCGKGEYRVKNTYDFRAGYIMMRRRQVDVQRKRVFRASRKSADSPAKETAPTVE